jgi:predicted heme/steroid binding protein
MRPETDTVNGRQRLPKLGAAWVFAAILSACGGGGGGGSSTGVEAPVLPGPTNPNGETVTGLYTFDPDLGTDENGPVNGPLPVTFKIFILSNGRVYAISRDDVGRERNFYLGNGIEKHLEGQTYSFSSSGIRDLPLPVTGAVPTVETVSLESTVELQNFVHKGFLRRSGLEVPFLAPYDQAFNTIIPNVANVALPDTHKYSGDVVVGETSGPGDIKGLGLRVVDKGNGTADLFPLNACNGQSGSLKPHAKGNFYDVSFSLKYGVNCAKGKLFSGHALVELVDVITKGDAGAPDIHTPTRSLTVMAADKELTTVMGFVGLMLPVTP